MDTPNLGANKFTFAGDRTQITYYPSAPGPIVAGQEGGKLEYQGIEGNHTFAGQAIALQASPLGTLVTITFPSNPDVGVHTCTLFVPQAFGVSRETPVTFETLAIKATGRGFTARPGVERTYTILPLLGTAADVLLPQ